MRQIPNTDFKAQFRGTAPIIVWGMRVNVSADGTDAGEKEIDLMSNQDIGYFLSAIRKVRGKFPDERIKLSALVIGE